MVKYSKEFRQALYENVIATGKSITVVATELQIPKSTATRLFRRAAQEKNGNDVGVSSDARGSKTRRKKKSAQHSSIQAPLADCAENDDISKIFTSLQISPRNDDTINDHSTKEDRKLKSASTPRQIRVDHLVRYLNSLERQVIDIDDLVEHLKQLNPLLNTFTGHHLAIRVVKLRALRRMIFTPYLAAYLLK